jgi:hypothetical protein
MVSEDISANRPVGNSVAAGDKFTLYYSAWMALLFLPFFFADAIERLSPLWLLLAPVLLIIIVCLWISFLVWNIQHRQRRRFISAVAAPIIAWGFFVMLGLIGITPERMRFELGRSHYLKEIAALPQTSEPRIASFHWDSTGFVGSEREQTLIYDEADEIALPKAKRPKDWKQSISKRCPGCFFLNDPNDPVFVHKITGHFYLVTEPH